MCYHESYYVPLAKEAFLVCVQCGELLVLTDEWVESNCDHDFIRVSEGYQCRECGTFRDSCHIVRPEKTASLLRGGLL